MKSIVLAVVASAALVGACKKDEAPKAPAGKEAAAAPAAKPAEPPKPVVFARIDIKNSGAAVKDLTIEAPQGATFKEAFTNTIVTAGPRFAILIGNRKEDIAGTKAAFAGPSGTIKASRFVVDAPDALLLEGTFLGEKGFHVNVAKEVGGVHWSCSSQRKMGVSFTQPEAEAMLRACRSLAKK